MHIYIESIIVADMFCTYVHSSVCGSGLYEIQIAADDCVQDREPLVPSRAEPEASTVAVDTAPEQSDDVAMMQKGLKKEAKTNKGKGKGKAKAPAKPKAKAKNKAAADAKTNPAYRASTKNGVPADPALVPDDDQDEPVPVAKLTSIMSLLDANVH